MCQITSLHGDSLTACQILKHSLTAAKGNIGQGVTSREELEILDFHKALRYRYAAKRGAAKECVKSDMSCSDGEYKGAQR